MTAKEISDRILSRSDDSSGATVAADPGGGVPPEILAYLNEGQELFAFLSLCLETTASLTIAANTTFATLRATFPDFLCPLRLTIAGVRVRPATFAELDVLNEDWQSTVGTPTRYVTRGFDFYAVTPQPALDTAANLTYARAPLQLVGDAFPELPEAYHRSLVSYGIYRKSLKEGGQALVRGMVQFNAFLDDATAHGDYVRNRSRAARYDTEPFELALFDRARLMQKPTKAKPTS